MIVSEVITLGTAIVSLLATIAGSSACVYFSSRNSKTNITVLKDKVRALEDLIQDAMDKVSSTAVMVPDPRQWLLEAQTLLSKLNVITLEKRLNEKCVYGMLPDCWVHRVTQSSIEEGFTELDNITERGKRILNDSTVRGFKLPEVSVVGRSRTLVEDQIWKLVSGEEVGVSDEEVGTICIHGTAGVGKTAVAIAIHNRALEKVGSLFDYIIWVSVRYDASLCQLQEDIANQLEIELPNSDFPPERARVLKNALLQKKMFLLVLDSVWRSFSVQDIGIPELVDGRRLIVTSRIRTVSIGGRRKNIEIKPLSRADAWNLFEKEVGAGSRNLLLLDHDNLIKTKSAVADLNGIPLAIKLLARSLSEIQHEDTPARLNRLWRKDLENSMPPSSFFGHSYENLSAEAQPCFQFCALFPKDEPIESRELIEYWIWEGLLGRIDTLERCRRRGQDMLKELKDAHLLEGSNSDVDKVMMLNIARHMAMAKDVHGGVFIKSGDSLTSLPPSHDWPPEVKRASFIQNQVKSLVMRNSEQNYTQLSTLLLQDNLLDSTSDATFFYKMRGLRVLDLSRTMISVLPPSLSYLTSLRALLLRGCLNLTKLPCLSRLQELIVLNLSGTPLDCFPDGLHTMMKLRSLDLTKTRLNFFPRNVVGRLIMLEELLLFTDHDHGGNLWRSKELHKNWKGAYVEELVGLKNLAVLELKFLNARVFNKYVQMAEENSGIPQRFRFHVGDLQDVGPIAENSVIVTGSPDVTLPTGISELRLTHYSVEINVLQLGGCLKDLTVLDVSHLSHLSYLSTFEMLGAMKMLKKLCVRSCKVMKEVVRPAAQDNPAKVVHHGLTSVVLFDLPNLQSVCRGQVLDCPRLLSLHVWRCDNLKLPMILGTISKKVEIRGDKSWIDSLTYDNPNNTNSLFCEDEAPHSNPNLRFVEASLPPEFKARNNSEEEEEQEEEEEEEKELKKGSSSISEKFDVSNWFWNWLG